MNIYNDIERYIETRTDIICNTFRDRERMKGILKDCIKSGNVESLNALNKSVSKIVNEISDIHKLTKKIDDQYQDNLAKIIDD